MAFSNIPGAASNDILRNVNVLDASELYRTFLTAGNILAAPDVLQISSFGFDDEWDDSVDMTNDVTDHWVEDNVAVEDHIGVAPDKITLTGRVSELAFSATTIAGITTALGVAENGLTQVDAYLGKYTPGATDAILKAITQAQNIAVQIEQGASRVAQIANYYNLAFGGAVMNKQQAAFAMLKALAKARILFTVYTPFQVYGNMAMTNIRARQPRGTKTISEFSVSMKQIQFVNNMNMMSFLAQYGGRAATGFQPQTSNGISTGVKTLASNVTSQFKSVVTLVKAL